MAVLFIFGALQLLAYSQTIQADHVTEVDDFPTDKLYSVEDLKSLLTQRQRFAREDDGSIFLAQDECSPRNMSVVLPFDYSDPSVFYYPTCVMLERCGGCSPLHYLSCEPKTTETVLLKVMMARTVPGKRQVREVQYVTVEEKRHLTCQTICSVTPDDCGPQHIFVADKCACECQNPQQSCPPGQHWDEDTCNCSCNHVKDCCDDGGYDCLCPFYFDHTVCQCMPRTVESTHSHSHSHSHSRDGR